MANRAELAKLKAEADACMADWQDANVQLEKARKHAEKMRHDYEIAARKYSTYMEILLTVGHNDPARKLEANSTGAKAGRMVTTYESDEGDDDDL